MSAVEHTFSFEEDRLSLDHVRLDPTGHPHYLANAPATLGIDAEVHDQVDAGGDRGYDEARADVLAGQHAIGSVHGRRRTGRGTFTGHCLDRVDPR